MDSKLIKEIEEHINEIGKIFQKTPHIFLTEGAMNFQLCAKLGEIKALKNPVFAKEGGQTIRLHSFIPFFDEERKKLSIRPDIVIIDPASTDLTRGPTIHFSTKNFSIQNAEFLIELKLNKIYKKDSMIKKIKKDMNKLKLLSERDLCKSMFVLFDKKGLFDNREINEFKTEKTNFLYFKPIIDIKTSLD